MKEEMHVTVSGNWQGVRMMMNEVLLCCTQSKAFHFPFQPSHLISSCLSNVCTHYSALH